MKDKEEINVPDYAKAVRTARALKGYKQKELADEVDVDPSCISLVERQSRNPSLSLLNKVAVACDISLSKLIQIAEEGI